MRTYVIAAALVVGILLAGPADSQDEERQPPCASSEARQFDFWIGSWTVYANDKIAGHNRISNIHNGCTLLEEYEAHGLLVRRQEIPVEVACGREPRDDSALFDLEVPLDLAIDEVVVAREVDALHHDLAIFGDLERHVDLVVTLLTRENTRPPRTRSARSGPSPALSGLREADRHASGV